MSDTTELRALLRAAYRQGVVLRRTFHTKGRGRFRVTIEWSAEIAEPPISVVYHRRNTTGHETGFVSLERPGTKVTVEPSVARVREALAFLGWPPPTPGALLAKASRAAHQARMRAEAAATKPRQEGEQP